MRWSHPHVPLRPGRTTVSGDPVSDGRPSGRWTVSNGYGELDCGGLPTAHAVVANAHVRSVRALLVGGAPVIAVVAPVLLPGEHVHGLP
jgi:hypothetical protein